MRVCAHGGSIDCVGCENKQRVDPGFAAGAICSHNQTYRLCSTARGDSSDWRPRTRDMLSLAKPHLASGALDGVYLGDELTAQGLPFLDLVAWIDYTKHLLNSIEAEAGLAQAPAAGGGRGGRGLELYYTSSTFGCKSACSPSPPLACSLACAHAHAPVRSSASTPLAIMPEHRGQALGRTSPTT